MLKQECPSGWMMFTQTFTGGAVLSWLKEHDIPIMSSRGWSLQYVKKIVRIKISMTSSDEWKYLWWLLKQWPLWSKTGVLPAHNYGFLPLTLLLLFLIPCHLTCSECSLLPQKVLKKNLVDLYERLSGLTRPIWRCGKENVWLHGSISWNLCIFFFFLYF